MNLDPILESSLQQLMLETESRPTALTRIPVVTMKPTKKAAAFLAFPGTLTAYVARKGSPILTEIREAVDGGEEKIAATLRRLHSLTGRRQAMDLSDAAHFVAKEPTIGEIRYGGRTMMMSLCLPDSVEVVVTAMPFNGGKIAADTLILAEYYKEDSPIRLEAIAVAHPPELTPAEKAALEQLPADEATHSIGPPTRCYALCAVAVAALVTVAATLCCSKRATDASWEAAERSARADSDQTMTLGPSATARRLLATRRRALRHQCSEI
jgi:hypothetical protein